MTLQVSTGFKSLLLASWPSIFNYGVIGIYNGTRPATADDAVTGSLLGIVTKNGYYWAHDDNANGLVYNVEGPYITKPVGAQWACSVTTNGTATWFRIYGTAQDLGDVRYDLPRIDGDISASPTAGAELVLPEVTLLVGDYVPIQSFLYTIPPLVGA